MPRFHLQLHANPYGNDHMRKSGLLKSSYLLVKMATRVSNFERRKTEIISVLNFLVF